MLSFLEPKRWWKYDIYWSLKSSCFELFRDGKYGLFWAKKLMERWYFTRSFWAFHDIPSLGKYDFSRSLFNIFTTTCSRNPNIIFVTYLIFFTFTSTFIVILTLIWISNSFVKLTFTFAWYMFCFRFDSFIYVITLNTLIFKYSVLRGTHTLLDKSLRVL